MPMLSLLERLTAEDDEESELGIRQEYGRLFSVTALYVDLKPGPGRLFSLLHYAFFVGVIIFNMILLLVTALRSASQDVGLFADTLHFLFITSIVAAFFVEMIHYRPCFARMNRAVLRLSIGEAGLRRKAAWKVFWPLYLIACGLTRALVTPILAAYLGESHGLVAGINAQLPLPYWTPYDSSTPVAYYITSGLQLVHIFVCTASIATANVSFIYCCMNTIHQLDELAASIRCLEARASAIAGSSNFENEDFVRAYDLCLRGDIIRHQTVLAFYNDFQLFVSNLLILPFVLGGCAFAAAGAQVIVAGRITGSAITSMFFCIGEMFTIFILCWYGEQVHQKSINIRSEVYFSKWYYCPKNIKRTMMIIQERAKKPITVMAAGIIPAKLDTFANVMNGAYSYFNIMLAFKK